jgi:glycosyltransferase involved in cell wall biosynthesis
MKVLIDARFIAGANGGIEQALRGLSESYSFYPQEDIFLTWLTFADTPEDFKNTMLKSGNVVELEPSGHQKLQHLQFIRGIPGADLLIALARSKGALRFKLPDEPDVVRELDPDVIHFPFQFGFKTLRPNIYQPHDFQHETFPKNFSRETNVIRKLAYAEMMTQATLIVVGNEWTRNDLKNKYPNFFSKCVNVPVYPQTLSSIGDQSLTSDLPIPYVFYPAAFWPHKNHITLFKAIQELNVNGFEMNLVLTGAGISKSKRLTRMINQMGLADRVRTLGYLSESGLAAVYKGSTCMVMPSLFESESLPIWEAFGLGVPVITARTTALPTQVGNAALIFSPTDHIELASLIGDISVNSQLREDLIAAGTSRLNGFDQKNSAEAYFQCYRFSGSKISLEQLGLHLSSSKTF